MKFLSPLFATLASLAQPGLAADFQTLAPVQAVTIYPNGATITRVITAEVPAGSHRVLFPITQEALNSGPPRIRSSDGFTLGAQELLPNFVTDPENVYNANQAAAFEALEAARQARLAQADRVAQAGTAVQSADARVTFLRSISGNALEEVDPEILAQTATMIGVEMATALGDLQTAQETLRVDQDALKTLEKALTQAQRDFERTAPPEGGVTMMAVSVNLETAQTIEFTLDYLTQYARWGVDYDLFLTRADTPSLNVSRKVVVSQDTDEVWSNISLVMSTADPAAQIDPSYVYPNQASLLGPQQKQRVSTLGASSREMFQADAVMVEPVVTESPGIFASVAIDGLSIRYAYPEKVTVHPGQAGLILALDSFDLEADAFHRAAPRRDETAFLMARFTNTTPEPMLPGTTSLYRDGAFVGRSQIGMIPAGAEETLAFGPLENLRLDFKVLANDTGDTGIISRSDQRQQALEFSVENLTAETQTVETLFALPFSEQEDLDVDINANPRPESLDFEQRRNVALWNLELAPGQKQIVRLDVTLDWPQGQVLNWRP